MAERDLLVICELNADIIVEYGDVPVNGGQVEILVDAGELVLGSSGAITAVGATKLGLDVAVAGAVGDDVLGRFVLDELRSAGVDISLCQQRPGRSTGMTVVLGQGGRDRTMLTFLGEIGRFSATDIPTDAVRSARHVHVSSYFLQTALWPGLSDLFAAAKASGTTTSIDPNYDPAQTWSSGLCEALGLIDIFLPNQHEVLAIASTAAGHQIDNFTDAARLIARLGPRVAVKLGARGAVAAEPDGTLTFVGAPPVIARETTGAGDSFNAGLLAGLLDGWPLNDALALATACGALATERTGGTAGQADRERAQQVARTLPPARTEPPPDQAAPS